MVNVRVVSEANLQQSKKTKFVQKQLLSRQRDKIISDFVTNKVWHEEMINHSISIQSKLSLFHKTNFSKNAKHKNNFFQHSKNFFPPNTTQ